MTHVGLHEGVRSALEQQPDHVHEASGRGGNERGPPILEEGQGGRKARARPQRGGGGGRGLRPLQRGVPAYAPRAERQCSLYIRLGAEAGGTYI